MIITASGEKTSKLPGGLGFMWVVLVMAAIVAFAILFGVIFGMVKLWQAVGVWTLLIIFAAVLLVIMARKSSFSFNFGFSSFKGAKRIAEMIFYTMCLVAAGFVLFYIVYTTRVWSNDRVDRILHPMKDRGEVAANCITCNTAPAQSKLTDIPKAGTYTFEANKSYFFDNVTRINRKYAVAKKGGTAHIHFETPAGNWSGIITDNPDVAYLDGNNTPIEYGGRMSIRFDEPVVVKVVFKEVKVN